MAHTVESLSKLLKKTPDQVISILADAGIKGKRRKQKYQQMKERY